MGTTIDEHRDAIERMRPADYLNSSYYERWLAGLCTLLIERGLLSPEELA
jgi:nitrile hydratase